MKKVLAVLLALSFSVTLAFALPSGSELKITTADSNVLIGKGSLQEQELKLELYKEFTGFAQLVVIDGDGETHSYEVMIGADGEVTLILESQFRSLQEVLTDLDITFSVSLEDAVVVGGALAEEDEERVNVNVSQGLAIATEVASANASQGLTQAQEAASLDITLSVSLEDAVVVGGALAEEDEERVNVNLSQGLAIATEVASANASQGLAQAQEAASTGMELAAEATQSHEAADIQAMVPVTIQGNPKGIPLLP